MQHRLRELTDAGIRVVAISVDDAESSRELKRHAGYTFTFLTDPAMDVIRRDDLALEDEGIARPGEFLVDASGTVRWRKLTDAYYVRARPEEVLAAAKQLP